MEPLNLEGVFWLESVSDDTVAGRLKFDAVNGAELDLIGSFHRLDELFNEIERPVRIHGIAGGKKLTLLDCIRTNQSIQVPGIPRERYRASVILTGWQLHHSQSQVFDAVRVKLRHLDSWVRKTGTVVNISPDEQSNGIGKIQVTHIPLEKEVVPTDIGVLELIFTYGFNPDPFHTITLTQSTALGVRFAEPRTLQDILRLCTVLRDLVTIGVDAPAFITEASLTHSDLVRESPKGKVSPIPIGFYAQGFGNTIQSEAKDIHPAQMLFTFDDIGGLGGIAQWLKTSAKFRIVIDSLLSHWYLPTIYTDNRFLNIIIAAEALERIRLNQQSFNFSDGLERLACFAGGHFEELVQDIEPWVNEIIRVRTNNLVHRGLREDIEGSRMFWLSESVYFLVVFCLLKESGVAESTLSNITHHQRFRTIAEELQSTK